jgi:hypothetical protein
MVIVQNFIETTHTHAHTKRQKTCTFSFNRERKKVPKAKKNYKAISLGRWLFRQAKQGAWGI